MGFVSLIMNLIFIIGLILITISLTRAYAYEPVHEQGSETISPSPHIANNTQQSIDNQYIPRKYLDEQFNPLPLKTTFHNMFGNSNSLIGFIVN